MARLRALLPVALAALCAVSPAQAQSCGMPADDADVVACATKDLQEQAGNLLRAYDTLAEALGPRAATGLQDDQNQWLRRVSGFCELPDAGGDFESLVARAQKLPQALCLRSFITARIKDLNARRGRAAEQSSPPVKTDYPAVQASWGDRLNPGGKAPLGRFAAYYLRSGKPATLVATDTVGEISINYPWNEFHGIKSEEFEGYWVGRFRYEAETPVRIEIDQSWSRTRVIIDRKLVYEGGSNARVPFVFSPGTHTIEVEYKNNWHTTGLSVAFLDAMAPVPRGELRSRLQALAPPNAVVQLAAVYESGARDNTVALKLAPSADPVILVLSSYHAVRWVIDNSAKVDVRAIVHGSHAPGSRIQTDERDKSVPRLRVEQALGAYDVAPRCTCTAGIFHCEGGSLGATAQSVALLTGFELKGFAGEYSPHRLAVPEIVMTPQVLADARLALEQQGKAQAECRKSARMQ